MADTKQEDLTKSLVGKAVDSVKYDEGYSYIHILFTDGTILEVEAEDCFDFVVGLSHLYK